LAKLVAALERQTLPRDCWELIVVDDGSVEAVELPTGGQFAMRLLRQSPAGPGPARNRGVEAARGKWVAFTAADCEPAPGWLAMLDAASRRWDGLALGGRVECGLPHAAAPMASHLIVEHLVRWSNRDWEDARFFTPNNLAMPVDGFRAVGGFGGEYGLGTGEDRDFCARWRASGRRMVAVPEASVRHTHPLTVLGLLRQQYRYGRGSGIFRRSGQALGKPVPFESLRFYWEAVLAPWRGAEACAKPRMVAGLLCASQLVNAAGVVREMVRRD
jgi:glycosyltransferase involved in cell wall biosynthesis